jgi:hypothetical protein
MSDAVTTLEHGLSRNSVALLRLLLLIILACSVGYVALRLDSPAFIRVAINEDGKGHEVALNQPYEVNTDKDGKSLLSLEIRRFLWQNGTLDIEMPDACIDRVSIRPEGVFTPIPVALSDTPLCNQITLDLSHDLVQGMNEIILVLHSDQPQQTTVYIAPQLFGAHVNSTLACICIFSALALAVFKFAHMSGLDTKNCIILTLGFVCYAMLLHLRPNLSYSNDLPGHIGYTQHMVHHWMRPYDYEGWEYFHPPLYYFLASRFYGAFDGSGVVSPLTAVRMFALLLYTTFCLFGLRTLQEAIQPRGFSYYIGALLIVFWPIGPTVATRISNDIAVYAAWAVTFYYLERGYRERSLEAMQRAVIFLGITFMVKSNALVLSGVVGCSLLAALCTGRLLWRGLLQGRSLLAFAILALGGAINMGRVIYTTLLHKPEVTHSYLGEAGGDFYPLSYFMRFDPADYILHPVVTWQKEPGFFNYFLKSMFYGEQQLGDILILPRMLNILLVIMLLLTAYCVTAAIRRKREAFAELVPELAGVFIPLGGAIAFTILKHYVFCQSVRYVLPMIIPLIILYVRGVRGMPSPVYIIGIMVGIGIICAAFIMNVWLYTHGEFT